MNGRTTRFTEKQKLLRRAAGVLLLFIMPACGLILDFDPPDGPILECTAIVRSADGHTEVVSSMTSPDFVVITTGAGGSTETAALREYFNCSGSNCPSSCPRADSFANTETDWQSWLGIRVREQSSVPTSVFGQFEGPWCVEPGTLSCRVAGAITGGVSCDALPSGDPMPLPVCTEPPPPPPGDPCLRIECDGTAPCGLLDYGSINVADSATRTVTVSNCGGTAAPDIALVLSGDILAQPAFIQRDFVVTRNQCLPDTPDEMLAGEEILTNPLTDAVNSRCEFDVTFSPNNPMAHGAEIAFRSDLDPRHSILLRGNGTGGTLSSVPPLEPEPGLCFSRVAGACTAPQNFAISNSGPGAVIITDIRLDTGAPSFEIVAPPPASLPITLRAGDPPLLVTVRWCDGPGPMFSGEVIITTNAPDTPTIILKLGAIAGVCP